MGEQTEGDPGAGTDVLAVNDGMVIGRDNLQDLASSLWPRWQKVVPTCAIRVAGPFRVVTSESENEPFFCKDGYLAVDARGYPYAIAKDEFELIYRPMGGAVTFFGLVDAAMMLADLRKLDAASGEIAREFAMAVTACEDAQMRYTRGRARELDVFRPADLDSVDALADRRRFLDDVEAARDA